MEEGDGRVTELDEFLADDQRGGAETVAAQTGQWTEDEWRQWNAQWRYSRSWWAEQPRDVATSHGPQGNSKARGSGVNEASEDPWSRWSAGGGRGWHEWEGGYQSAGKWYGKGEFGDPPAWAGWGHYRLWKKAVQRWDRNTDIATWRRSDRLLRVLDWELQQKLEHLPETELATSAYLELILQVLDVLAGEKLESEKRRKVRAALYEGGRQANESLAEYSLRREAQFTSAAPYVNLPDDLKAIMMEEQAGLSRQGLQNLRVLTQGQSDYDQVRKALRILDTEEESVLKGSGKASYFLQEDPADVVEIADDEVSEDDEEFIYFTIEQQGMFEDEATNFLAEWKGRKRSWAQNKELKAARKKDRRHFEPGGDRPPRPESKKRLSIEELKKVTRCRNCQQLGHWKEDCKNPYVPRQGSGGHNQKTLRDGGTAFAFLGTAPGGTAKEFWNFHEQDGLNQSFLELPPGFAVIDPGASQDLIGKKAFHKLSDRLAQSGLQPVILPGSPPSASGIGGQAKPLFCALAPCFLGGKPGVVRLTVLDEDIPHLISIGLLEFSKAVIDTDDNTIFFKAFNRKADMTRLESGHRIVDVGSSLDAGELEVPSQILEEFGLKPDAFKLDLKSEEAYMSCGSVSWSKSSVERFLNCFQPSCNFEGSFLVNQNLVSVVFHACTLQKPPVIMSEVYPWRVSWLVDHDGLVFCAPPVMWEVHDRAESERVGVNLKIITGFFHEEHDALRTISDVKEFCSSPHDSQLRPVLQSNKSYQGDFEVPNQHLDGVDHSDRFLPSHEGRRKQVSFDLQRSCEVRGSPGESSVGLVLPHSHVAACQQDVVQSQLADPEWRGDSFRDELPGEATLHSSSLPCCQGGQSVGNLDEVQEVSEQADLSALRVGQPSSQILGQEREEPGGGHLHSEDRGCAQDGFGKSRSCGRLELSGHDELAGDDRQPDHGHVSGYGADYGQHDGSGFGASGSRSADDARDFGAGTANDEGIIGGSDAHAATSASDASIPEPDDAGQSVSHPTYVEDESCDQRGRWGGRVDELGVPGGGLSLRRASMSVASLSRSLGVSQCTDVHGYENWFVASLNIPSLKTFGRSSSFFFVQSRDSGVFACWKDCSLSKDLIFNDENDDHEFQISKKVKRELTNSICHNPNSFGHFVPCHEARLEQTARDPDNPRTGKAIEGQQTARAPANPSTGRKESKLQEENEETARERGPRTLDEETVKMQEHLTSIIPSSDIISPPLGLPSGVLGSNLVAMDRKWKVCELFSPARVTPQAKAAGFDVTEPPSFDQTEGWDFFDCGDRKRFWEVLETQQPDLLVMSPECRLFSQIMNLNWEKMKNKDEAGLRREQHRALAMLHFCVQVAEYQLRNGRYFLIEHPGGASSWSSHAMAWLLRQEGVIRFEFDQCMTGLAVQGEPNKKMTGIVTNHLGIAALLSQYQCDHQHSHQPLVSGLPAKAQIYPQKLVQILLRGISNNVDKANYVEGWPQEEQVEDPQMNQHSEDLEEELDREVERENVVNPGRATISDIQKKKVQLVHTNMGHLPRDQMLLLLKAAGAKPEVLEYVKSTFGCEACMRQKRPVERRKAAFPRTFSFNRIISIDFFYVALGEQTLAFLNVVCHGTNYQQVDRLLNYSGGVPSAQETWKLFNRLWIASFGVPETLLCDGGSEFKGYFERSLELHGVLQVISDAASPWQNGRCERHGAWLKEKIELELQSGQTTISDAEELTDLARMVVSQKNRYFHRGGFSPYQLVFGANPKIPFELLGDDEMLDPVREEIHADAFEQDTAAASFLRSVKLRQKAKDLCMKNSAWDKVQLSSAGPRRHIQRNWAVGQWVYVWRKHPGTGGGHVTRCRWVGPGLVVMQSGHSVWVSMRARLWKCNSDQLRAASHHESLGAELSRAGELQEIIQQTRSSRAGAIDITREAVPGPDEMSVPVPSGENQPPRAIVEQQVMRDREEEEPSPGQAPGRGFPLRDVSHSREAEVFDAPLTTSGRSSLRSVEEPLQEPPIGDEPSSKIRRVDNQGDEPSSTTIPDSSSGSSSSPRTPSSIAGPRIRRQASDFERLEREAVRELRRLNRLERSQGRSITGTLTPGTPQPGTPSPGTPGVRPLSSVPEEVEEQEPPRDEATGFFENHQVDVEPLRDEATGFFENHQVDVELGKHAGSFFAVSTVTDKEEVSFLIKSEKGGNSGEFNMKGASPEERLGFEASDQAEWNAICNQLGAVKIHQGLEAEKLRCKYPHRVITSRMIRRKKPTPGVGNYKFKSRWCVHGHKDPDSGSFQTFSPMPAVESITMFFQLCLNLDLSLSFGDVKNAFCQGDPLVRPAGPILVTPCEGLDVPQDALIELVAPVYGLDDAPLRWHQTVVGFLEQLGFHRSLLEPCLLLKRENGSVTAMVLIEVDDLNLAAREDYMPELKEKLQSRFIFGKFEDNEADFAGRRVKKTSDKVIMHQEKYIVEKIFPLNLSKGRASCKDSILEADEFEAFRSLLYRVNWLAHQTRPEAAGVVSILASRLRKPTIHDVCCLNKLVLHLRSSAQQSLTLHRFDNDKMIFIAASDAGGVDGVPPSAEAEGEPLVDCTQGAWLIMASDQMPSANVKARVSILTWRSSKLRRRVSSTLGGEALAFSQALGELEWLQIMFRDIAFGDVCRNNWRKSIMPYVAVLKENCCLKERLEQCAITDAKSLFDSINKQNPSSRQDRRTAVELAIIIEGMKAAKSVLRWAPHPRMWADTLTKDDISKTNGALEELLRTSKLVLWKEKEELDLRKLQPKTKNRSRRAASLHRSLLKEGENLLSVLSQLQVNSNLGVLLNEYHRHPTMLTC